MPHSAPYPCRFAGCRALTFNGVLCDAHRRVADISDTRRPNSSARGYTSTWRRLRIMVLRREPLCQWPECNEPANQVDHIVPLSKGGTNEFSNLQSLCARHHSITHALCAECAKRAKLGEGVGGVKMLSLFDQGHRPRRARNSAGFGGWGVGTKLAFSIAPVVFQHVLGAVKDAVN
ncbi:MAG: HNH endonuclease [Planctomycetes bacterium]|nr:HNH endonuclease [Planctomycetota bacterium]